MSDNSLFGGLDAEDIADDPFDIPDDKYEVVVKDAFIKESKSGKMGLNLVYQITAGKPSGQEVRDWFQVGAIKAAAGSEEYDKQVRSRSFLKKRLLQLGLTEDRMGANFDPTDLVGITGYVKTKKRDDNVNIQSFELGDTGEATAAPTRSNPFAS